MSAPPRSPAAPAATDRPTALIVGCGYLGRRLAPRLLEQGRTVYATTRSEASARSLAPLGVRPLLLQVTQPLTYASLGPALRAPTLDVVYMVPPGRPGLSPSPRQTVLGGIAHTIKQLRRASVRRAVLVSSSAVYGQSGGQRVDADTPPQPAGARAKLLLEGERLWLDAGPAYRVVRLAGIYGPGRVVGLKAVRGQAPLLGDPEAMLNLIHVDDAADLLLAVLQRDTAARTELGCDGSPTARITYYRDLAQRLGVPPPPMMDSATAAALLGVDAQRLGRSSNKALDNRPTRRRTGWTPRYPSYREGLAGESLKAEVGSRKAEGGSRRT